MTTRQPGNDGMRTLNYQRNHFFVLGSCVGLLALACQPTPSPKSPTKASVNAPSKSAQGDLGSPDKAKTSSLVVYSGRSAGLMEPLFKQFEDKTGIEIKARFDKSTQTLANRIASEGNKTEADVLLAQDSGYLGALAKAGLLAKLDEEVTADIPAAFKDKDGRWTGVSGRARVLVYSPERVKVEELPKSLEDLTEPKWKGRIGWAPSNASFQAHISALRNVWGEDKVKAWLKGISANAPVVYPKNSPQVRAVSKGEIDVGWVNHYYLHKLKAADPGLKVANHSFSATGDPGNLMMVSGIGITKASKRKKPAQRLVKFLLSKQAQTYLAQKIFEYPLNPSVKPHTDVPSLGSKLANVDQEALTDIANTVKLLRELGLQ